MALLNFALLRFRYGFRPTEARPGAGRRLRRWAVSSSGAAARPGAASRPSARGGGGRLLAGRRRLAARARGRALPGRRGPAGPRGPRRRRRRRAHLGARLGPPAPRRREELPRARRVARELSSLERGGLPARGDRGPALRADGRDRAAPPRGDRPLRGGRCRASPPPTRSFSPASAIARGVLFHGQSKAAGRPLRARPDGSPGAACGGRSPGSSRPLRHRRCRHLWQGRGWTPLPSSRSSAGNEDGRTIAPLLRAISADLSRSVVPVTLAELPRWETRRARRAASDAEALPARARATAAGNTGARRVLRAPRSPLRRPRRRRSRGVASPAPSRRGRAARGRDRAPRRRARGRRPRRRARPRRAAGARPRVRGRRGGRRRRAPLSAVARGRGPRGRRPAAARRPRLAARRRPRARRGSAARGHAW